MNFWWTPTGPRTHRRRTCETCRKLGMKGACLLPFRRRTTRRYAIPDAAQSLIYRLRQMRGKKALNDPKP